MNYRNSHCQVQFYLQELAGSIAFGESSCEIGIPVKYIPLSIKPLGYVLFQILCDRSIHHGKTYMMEAGILLERTTVSIGFSYVIRISLSSNRQKLRFHQINFFLNSRTTKIVLGPLKTKKTINWTCLLEEYNLPYEVFPHCALFIKNRLKSLYGLHHLCIELF